MSPRAKYRIAIVNMMKPDSLFSAGMRPLLYSTTDAARGVGWVRCGENVCYFANQYTYVPTSSKKKKGSGAAAERRHTTNAAVAARSRAHTRKHANGRTRSPTHKRTPARAPAKTPAHALGL
eukprot:4520035-Pleurochrysis_carterae.AAC.1